MRNALLLIAITIAVAIPARLPAQDRPADITVFVREGCPHCRDAKEFLQQLSVMRPGLRVELLDVVEEPAALERFREVARQHQVGGLAVPAFLIDGRLLIGFIDAETTGPQITAMLDGAAVRGSAPGAGTCDVVEGALPAPCAAGSAADSSDAAIDVPVLGRVTVDRLGLPLFTIVIGLLDGFNPCAMYVLLFLLSMLMNLRSRARMALIAGIFVVVSGVVYFAFMAAWLNVFLVIGMSRGLQLALAATAGVMAVINLKDFVAFGRGISLKIPESAKPRIYARSRQILKAEKLLAAVAGVVVLAALVNLVELLCTAGLPALYTQILTLRGLGTAEYYGYLGLYNLAYMFDDGVMVAIAVVTLSHKRLQQGEARWLKLVSGTVMLGLAVVLAVKPEWIGG